MAYVLTYADGRESLEQHSSIPAALKVIEVIWHDYTFQRTGNSENGNPVEVRSEGELVATITWRD